MKYLTATIVVILLAASAHADSLCVATYNLNYANRRGDQVLDAIAAAHADVICFQETTVQSEQFLRERLLKTHPHFYSVGHTGRYHAERFAFASTAKLTDVKYTLPDAGLFGFYTANLDIAGHSVRLVNVHLTPFQLRRGSGIAEVITALSTTEKIHQSEIASIVDTLDLQRPTIILGDFNSLSTGVAPKRLLELGMTDAIASVHENADAHPTWSWPTRPIPLALRIDYIFHTPHFTATRSEVISREGSDHALVFAMLTFGEQSAADETVPR